MDNNHCSSSHWNRSINWLVSIWWGKLVVRRLTILYQITIHFNWTPQWDNYSVPVHISHCHTPATMMYRFCWVYTKYRPLWTKGLRHLPHDNRTSPCRCYLQKKWSGYLELKVSRAISLLNFSPDIPRTESKQGNQSLKLQPRYTTPRYTKNYVLIILRAHYNALQENRLTPSCNLTFYCIANFFPVIYLSVLFFIQFHISLEI